MHEQEPTAPMTLASTIADTADHFEGLLLEPITEFPTSYDERAVAEWRERIREARAAHTEIGALLDRFAVQLPTELPERDQIRRVIVMLEAEAKSEKGSTRMRVFLRETAALWRKKFQDDDGLPGWPADVSD